MNVTNTTQKVDIQQNTNVQSVQAQNVSDKDISFKETLNSVPAETDIQNCVPKENVYENNSNTNPNVAQDSSKESLSQRKNSFEQENNFDFVSKVKDNNPENTVKIAEKELVNEIMLIRNSDNMSQSLISENKLDEKSGLKKFDIDNKDFLAIPEDMLAQNIIRNQQISDNNLSNKGSLTPLKPIPNKTADSELDVLTPLKSISNKTADSELDVLTPLKPIPNKTADADLDGILKVKQSDMRPIDDVAGLDSKQAIAEMKVLRIEPAESIVDTTKSLLSSKTTDIVNFIDANLSVNKSKISKTSKSSASEVNSSSSDKNTLKMTEADAKFFNDLIENNEQVMQGAKQADVDKAVNDIQKAQSAEVSKTLLNALKESQENNKSFRVDFDKDISVILKVNKDGQISAEFIPGDKAVEQYLKNNIPLLKQKFSDEGLEYENLSYKQQQSKKERDKEERRNGSNYKENN